MIGTAEGKQAFFNPNIQFKSLSLTPRPRRESQGGSLGLPAAGGRCTLFTDLSAVNTETGVKLRRQLLLRRWPRRSERKSMSDHGGYIKVGVEQVS